MPKTKRIERTLIAMLALCLAGSVAGAVELNLLVNPDFSRGAAAVPFVPEGWQISIPKAGPTPQVSREGDPQTALRVRTGAGETVTLRQAEVEVVPGSSYVCGVSAQGKGKVTVRAAMREPAPEERLADLTLAATPAWQSARKSGTVGVHRHLAYLQIQVDENADVLLRGAELSVTTADTNSPELLVTGKPVKDAGTLWFEDFDGAPAAFSGGGAMAADGRYGKGLRTSSAKGGVVVKSGVDLPETGTIEFFFKPHRLPATNEYMPLLVVKTQSPGLSNSQLEFQLSPWMTKVHFGFRRETYKGDFAETSLLSNGGWGTWRTNEWRHLAGSWDGDAFRLYVDGVLAGIRYGRDKVFPTGRGLDIVVVADGVIDEIRISKGQRFGPVMPVGATPVSYSPPVPPAVEPALSNVKPEPTEEELDKERAKMVSASPAVAGDYAFGVSQIKPGWEGMPGTRVIGAHFGADGAGFELDTQGEIGRAAYWRMEGIETGAYTVGLWVETGHPGLRTEYFPVPLLVSAYVNGWPLRFRTTSDPIQVAPGRWMAELQAARPVVLKNGDEIAFSVNGKSPRVFRLDLHKKEPLRGHGITGQTFGVDNFTPQRLRLVIQAEIVGSGVHGESHEARVAVGNPLPYAADFELDWGLADHYGTPVTGKIERLRLEAHQALKVSHPFTAVDGARAYQLSVRTRPVRGFVIPVARPREFLELNDYTRFEFLPDQPDPLTVWRHARKDIVCDKTGDRMALPIDDRNWEWAFLEGRRVPDTLPAGLVFSPGMGPNQVHAGRFGKWLRKGFTVPPWLRGQRFLLEMRAICEGTVFLNGVKVGYRRSQYLPLSCDVTAALSLDGTNELVVCVRNSIALIHPDHIDDFVVGANGVAENQNWAGRTEGGIGAATALSAVQLRTLPEVYVSQSLVITDVEKKTVKIMTRVRNLSAVRREITLEHRVLQKGQPTTAVVPAQTLALEPGVTQEVAVEGPAGNLAPYTPKNPVLAAAETTVMEKGRGLDTFTQRFGYRSLKIKGTGMELNGEPFKPKGAFMRYSHNVFEGEDGFNVSRDLYEREDARAFYDEIGLLHYMPAGGIQWAQGWKLISNPHYGQSLRDEAVEIAWDRGSHPSLVGWNLSNESYHYAPYVCGSEGQDKHGEVIYSIAQAIWKKIWPGFWCLADGDDDLGGRLNFYSFHYANEGALYKFIASPTGGFGHFDGVSHYAPDSFFINGARDEPKVGTICAMRPNWSYGATACGNTETYLVYSPGVGIAKYIGDRAAVSSGWLLNTARGMGQTKLSMDGYRDMEMAFIGGIYWKSFIGAASRPVSFIMPEQTIRYYAGSTFDRRISLLDEDFEPGALDFRWRLVDADGKVWRKGRIKARSDTAYLKRDRVRFDLPDVRKRTTFTLMLDLAKDGRRRACEERILEVWPALGKVASRTPVAVLDPAGKTVPVLERLGCTVKPLADLSAASLAGVSNLIIGADCPKSLLVESRPAFLAFVRAGGRALILRQEDSSLLPFEAAIEKRAWFSAGFVCTGSHPVMAGLKDMDFQMWNPDHLMAKGMFRKPKSGNVTTLVDAGHDGHMNWAALLEMTTGAGSVVATQLRLTEVFEQEPMCAEVLRRLLDYMNAPPFRKPTQRLAVLKGAGDTVIKRLKDVRAEFEVVGNLDDQRPVTLLDLNAAQTLPEAAAIRAYADKGGTLIVHRANPSHRAWLEAVTGRKVAVNIQPYQSWVDRQALDRRDGLAAGLNNLDLYWRTLVVGEGPDATFQVSNGVRLGKERGQTLYVVTVDGVKDYLFPGGLAEVPIGQGRIIIDQLKWDVSDKDMVSGSPARVVSTLLYNLNVNHKEMTPKPVLPKGVIFAPVDLSGLANLSFRDDKAGDGQGWLDWGPDADLRDFPTGKVSLCGVPFQVPAGDRNAVCLRVTPGFNKALSTLPDRIVIPVGGTNVAGLVFLHTGGWANGSQCFGRREIEYTDGTREVISLDGSNVADWNYGRDEFLDEEGTTTLVAWKGASAKFATTRVYLTTWVNPHPAKAIRQVVISNAGLDESMWRFIPHLALTVALQPSHVIPVAQAQRDTPGSATRLKEALALLAAGKTTEAAVPLEAALQADDRNSGAWIALTELRARTDTVEAFTVLCRRWFAAMPENYQAHNVLGRFLEGKGRIPEATAEYRASLVIEWNQPFIMQALERLGKK